MTVTEECAHCHQEGPPKTVLNGAYYRHIRKLTGLDLKQMADLCGVGIAHLSKIEQGYYPFREKDAQVYERAYRRHRAAGDE